MDLIPWCYFPALVRPHFNIFLNKLNLNTMGHHVNIHLDTIEKIRRKGLLWIKVLGRTEESLLINGVVVVKQELIRVVNDFIGHPHFFFVVDKHRLNYGDKLIINVANATPKNLQLLPSIVMKTLGLDNHIVARKHKGDIPRTFNGKIKYFISMHKE